MPSLLARRYPSLLALLGLSLTFTLPASGQAGASAIDSSRVAWLSEHALILDDPLALREWSLRMASARTVALGEPTHGDGAAFELRNRLTRALVEEAGFNRLALEAMGAFDPADSLRSGSAFLWSRSEQAWPGLAFALSSGLTIEGMDVQHRHHHRWWNETETALGQVNKADSSWNDVRSILQPAFSNPFAPVSVEMQERVRIGVANIGAWLRRGDRHDLARFLDNALANAATAWEQDYAPRNRQMAANLLSMIEREGHVVVWAASSHMVRSLQAIDTMTEEWSYDGARTVGEYLGTELGNGYRMIAFSACGGSYGAEHIRLTEYAIAPLQEGSLEALICQLPFEHAAFVDLREAWSDHSAGWLQVPLLAGPLGYEPKRASWPLVIDGLIVMRTMTPSSPRSME